ncbi:hypothetical protein [Georgenia sp. SUBG003]|uniref:hypothetical protein n=1 Tax=Georgenia sp. SUBG003 TaxID=1497974 RepID=UPI0004D51154|nr:hypothetical protein DA06_06390 [Georgenia sp. SUBG003]
MTADRDPFSARRTPVPGPSDARTTPEASPAGPVALAAVPGLEAIGDDAVGFCGPDGCFPAGPYGPPAS